VCISFSAATFSNVKYAGIKNKYDCRDWKGEINTSRIFPQYEKKIFYCNVCLLKVLISTGFNFTTPRKDNKYIFHFRVNLSLFSIKHIYKSIINLLNFVTFTILTNVSFLECSVNKKCISLTQLFIICKTFWWFLRKTA
jgi:hypothetical protein